MNPRRKKRPSTRGSRANRRQTSLFIVAFIAVASLISSLIFSMGSRTPSQPQSPLAHFNTLRNKVRNFEKASEPDRSLGLNDSRAHAGFHFDWPKRFSAPEWKMTSNVTKKRTDDIQNTLKLGKSQILLSPRPENSFLFDISERLASNSESFIVKRVIPVLPGEKVLFSYPSNDTLRRRWKIRTRVVATTQDRLDAPQFVNSGYYHGEPVRQSIDPKERGLDVAIPSAADLANRGEQLFFIEWPASASGLLLLDGIAPTNQDNELGAFPVKTLIVHIDSLDRSLPQLSRTLSILNEKSSSAKQLIYVPTIIPPSESFDLSHQSLLTLRHTIDLGATVSHPKLRELIPSEALLLNKYFERGGSVRFLSLSQRSGFCPQKCEHSTIQGLSPDDLTASLNIDRREEIQSTADLVGQGEFLNAPGVLIARIKFPASSVRLNWTTALSEGESLFRWSVGGFKEYLGQSDLSLKNREKSAQLDVWLSKTIEKFLSDSERASVAIYLHENVNHLSSSQYQNNRLALKQGEALFYVAAGKQDQTKQGNMVTAFSPLSLLSAAKIFEKLNHSKDAKDLKFWTSKDFDTINETNTQILKDTMVTLTSDGWLTDQIPNREGSDEHSQIHVSTGRLFDVQQKSMAERLRTRLHGLHILFPNTNQKDELVSVTLSTDLQPIGCESESEHTQLDLQHENQGESGVSLNSFKILGRRSFQSQWHLHCLLAGRISTSTRLRMTPHIDDQAVPREKIGLGEFALPVRGFLWHSPDTVELTGAQILDATISIQDVDKSAAQQTSTVIWTDRIPGGLPQSRSVLPLIEPAQSRRDSPPTTNADRLSGK